MHDFLIACAAYLIFALSVVFCVLPLLPGQLLAAGGFFLIYLLRPTVPMWCTITVCVVAVAATVADYTLPALGAKRFNTSSLGIILCTVGTIVGAFFGFIGILVGPFLGAFLGEVINGKDTASALRGGLGAFLGFLMGTGVKLIATGCTIYLFAHLHLSA